jgi:pimeloyl-ACP methyl ester carboxylesterase
MGASRQPGEAEQAVGACAGPGFLERNRIGRPAVAVAFGGLSFRPDGVVPFEFLNLLCEIDIDQVFVPDIEQCFYQRGVAGLGQSIWEVGEGLRQLVAGHEQVIFVGVSAGGYAALLLGSILRVNHVVAISPQTFLGRGRRRLYGERRFARKVGVAQQYAAHRQLLDVKPAVRRNAGATRFHVYYPTGHALDRRHARRLGRLRGVELHPAETTDHAFVRQMRDDGSLKSLLLGIVGQP